MLAETVLHDLLAVDRAQVGADDVNARLGVRKADTVPRRPVLFDIPSRQSQVRRHVALTQNRDSMPNVLDNELHVRFLDDERERRESSTSSFVSLNASEYRSVNAQVSLSGFQRRTFTTQVIIFLARVHHEIGDRQH